MKNFDILAAVLGLMVFLEPAKSIAVFGAISLIALVLVNRETIKKIFSKF